MPQKSGGSEASGSAADFRPRILVAEDNFLNQKLAEAMLDKLGYDADIVGTGTEAVQAVREARYDAVLMDAHMPEMDGFQATAEIRKGESSSRRVPIIALTGSVSTDDRERCLAAGMDDHVAKPIQMEELRLALERWAPLGSKRLEPSSSGDPDSPNTAALDADRLADLRTLDRPEGPTALSMLGDIFLRDAPDRLVTLRHAVLENDAEAAQDVAHYLRGAAANLGATRVAAVCGELERAARSKSLTSAPELLARLDAEFEKAQEALEAELAHATGSLEPDDPL